MPARRKTKSKRKTLPAGVYRYRYGWRVLVRRDGVLINGGHYSGPEGLENALKAKEQIEKDYPKSRTLGRPKYKNL